MYHVRFAGGRVKSELQLRSRLSPMEYLQITKDVTIIVKCFCRTGRYYIYYVGNDPQIIRNSRPFFVKTSNPGPILRNHHNQEVGVGAVSGEHGALPADLAPVPPSAGLGELVQVD